MIELKLKYHKNEIIDDFRKQFNKTKYIKMKKEYDIKISTKKSDTFELKIKHKNKTVKTYLQYKFDNIIKFIKKNFDARKSNKNFSLYSDDNPKTTLKGLGFKDANKAKETIKLIKKRDKTYQKQVINTMINRAKYHPHQTNEMKEAIKIFKEYYKLIKS